MYIWESISKAIRILLLSKGSTDDKKKIIKKYLNEHINNTKEKITINSNLVINLLEFKKVILTYISCVSTRGLENVIKALDNDPKEAEFLNNAINSYGLNSKILRRKKGYMVYIKESEKISAFWVFEYIDVRSLTTDVLPSR